MDQDIINNIYNMYPWASEDTMQKVNGNMQEQNIHMGTVAAVLSKKDAAAIKEMSRTTKQGKTKSKASGRAALKTLVIGQGALTRIIADSNPANAVAEISHEASKLLANAGIGISNMGFGMGKFGAIVKGVARHAGTPLVVATGLGVTFAKLLTEQEKQARKLIEFGAVVSDIDHWSNLRYATRDLGMGLKDFEDVMSETKSFITQAEGGAFAGALRMAEFAKEIDSDKTFRDFGMGIQDQTRFIGQEIQTLYELGEITAMNDKTKKRVIESYRTANNVALFTANAFGMQREEALRLRDEARQNVDIRVAMIQNAEHIKETYGDAAEANITDAVGTVRVMNEALMGSEFAMFMEEMIAGFVGDISYDDSAANNISEEWIKTLQSTPGASSEIISFVEKLGTGQFKNEQETIEAYREIFRLLKNSEMVVTGNDPQLQKYNDLIATAKTAAGGTEFLRADLDTLSTDFFANYADQSDASIEVMNNMAIAFQNAQELLTPGFSAMGHGVSVLSDGVMNFGSAISRAFGNEERWDEGVSEMKEENIQKRLAEVNEYNITDAITRVNEHIDTLASEMDSNRGLLYEIDDEGNLLENKDGEYIRRDKFENPNWKNDAGEINEGQSEFMTEEQISAIETQYLMLEDRLRDSREYLIRLQEKDNDYKAQAPGSNSYTSNWRTEGAF